MTNRSRVVVARRALCAVAIAVVVTSGLIGGTGESADARRYGGRYKKKYNYAERIERCRSRCGRTSSATRACAARARKQALRNCKSVYKGSKAACTGDAACGALAKEALKQCAASAKSLARSTTGPIRYASRSCGRCCKQSRGSYGCGFDAIPGYGYRRYGRLHCAQPTPSGSPSGAFPDVSDGIRAHLARLVPWAVSGWAD